MEVLNGLLNWIKMLFAKFDEFLKTTMNLDQNIVKFYNLHIAPLPEWVKWISIVGGGILLLIGAITFLKKAYKFILVVLIIVLIIALVAIFV